MVSRTPHDMEAWVSQTNRTLARLERRTGGVVLTAASADTGEFRVRVNQLRAEAVTRAKRALVGGHVEGVGVAPNIAGNYYNPTHTLEWEMRANFDIVSWYQAVGIDTADDFVAEVVPELDANPTRRVMYALEIWRTNPNFIAEFDAQGPIYEYLVNLFTAIKGSGHDDRIHLAPFHECNGGGNVYPWQAFDAARGNSVAGVKAAFERVVSLARSMELRCPFIQWYLTTSDDTAPDQYDLESLYVGDEWADLVGVSYYNRSGAIGESLTWVPVGATLRRFVRQVEGFSGRGVWVCESGCAQSNQGEDKGQWYSDLVRLAASDDLPRLEAVCLFLQDGDTTNFMLENDEQKRMLGRAINDSHTVVEFTDSTQNRNLLPANVSIPTTTTPWSTGVATGLPALALTIEPNAPSTMDAGTTSLRVTKTASTGTSDNNYSIYRLVTAASFGYEIGKPYALTFKARASVEGFRIGAGMREPGGAAQFVGATRIELGTVWKTYVVPMATTLDLTTWRMPVFRFGLENRAGWFEVTDIRFARGTGSDIADTVSTSRLIGENLTSPGVTYSLPLDATVPGTQNLYGSLTYTSALGPRWTAGSSAVPTPDERPVVWATKYSSADRTANPAAWDNGVLYGATIKRTGSAFAVGITGYAKHEGGTGQMIGVHGRGEGNHVDAQVWGGWSYGISRDATVVNLSTIGHEINVVNRGPDQGWMQVPGVGNSRGLVAVTADASNPVTAGVYIGRNSAAPLGHLHTALLFGVNSVVPSGVNTATAVNNNEAIRIEGATTVAAGHVGIRFRGGNLRLGLSFAETTFSDNAAILLGDTQRIVVGAGPSTTRYLEFKSTGTPAVNFNNLAIHLNGVQIIGARDVGWTLTTGTTLQGGFNTATATPLQVAQTVGALVNVLMNHGLIGT